MFKRFYIPGIVGLALILSFASVNWTAKAQKEDPSPLEGTGPLQVPGADQPRGKGVSERQ